MKTAPSIDLLEHAITIGDHQVGPFSPPRLALLRKFGNPILVADAEFTHGDAHAFAEMMWAGTLDRDARVAAFKMPAAERMEAVEEFTAHLGDRDLEEFIAALSSTIDCRSGKPAAKKPAKRRN